MSTAAPMDDGRRMTAYLTTNWYKGVTDRLTPRQRRRALHKRNHMAAPFGKQLKVRSGR